MSGYDEYYVPRQSEPGLNPWLIRLPVLLMSGGILFLALLVGLVLGFQTLYADKITPGVSAYGVDLSGKTEAEAVQALRQVFTYDQNAVFTFRYGERFWQASAGELGIQFDADTTVDQAFAMGHSGNPLSDLGLQASAWLNGRSVAPIVRYDQQVTLERLNAIATELNRAPVDATINISGTTVVTTPSQNGLALDIPATLTQLETALLQLNTGEEITLVVNEAAPAVRDADQAAAKLNAALASPLTLITDNQRGGTLGPWVASVDQIKSLLALKLVTNEAGSLSYDVEVNVEPLRGFVQSLAAGLISLPEDGRFHFNEETRQLEMIKASINGRQLDVDGTLAKVRDAVFDPQNRVVPLAFSYTLPRYSSNITAAELGITQMVGEATTYYVGSTQSRTQNIIEALERFNGLIIAPGEEFSFNAHLGDISVETGFVQGKIIFGGRTVEGVGGGVCQISTTIFRAALKAGFPISERHSHGYRVGFYEQNNQPPGLDAAIFQPTADFRFVNDTPHHLLLETSVFPQDQSVQFRLYSTNPGRQVILEGPVIRDVVPARNTIFESNAQLQLGQEVYVDWAKEGADITFTRRILDAQGNEIRTDTIFTSYQPWAAVIQVAPTDPRLAQQQTG